MLFDRRVGYVLAGAGIWFLIMNLFQIHGFSYPVWEKILGNESHSSTLVGHAQWIRADDWGLDLPLALAQRNHEPPFPVLNQNIGSGVSGLLPFRVPVASLTGVFRPHTWGFFISSDVGLSWLWWSLVLGIFTSFFLLFHLLSRGNLQLSLLASGLLVYSPFFQLWSFHKAEIAAFGALGATSFLTLFLSKNRREILLSGFLLGGSIGGYALAHIYPAHQVPVAYFFLFLVLGTLWDRKKELRLGTLQGLSLLIALGMGTLAIVSFYFAAKPAIETLSQTVYPGQRVSLGGNLPWETIFTNYFLIKKWGGTFGYLSNVCEAAYGFFFFPVLALLFLKNRGKEITPILILFLILVFLAFASLGFPEFLARLTFMGKSTANRMGMALLLADITLLVLYFSQKRKKAGVGGLGILLLIMIATGWQLSHKLPEMSHGYLVFIPLWILFFWHLLVTPKVERALTGLLLFSFIYSMSFNPIVRGGTETVYGHPLSQKMRSLPKGTWAVMGDSWIKSLPVMLGIHSITGHICLPDFKHWQLLDPNGKYKHIYNQCAYVSLFPHSGEPLFESPAPGQVRVGVSPSRLSSLDVRYVLTDETVKMDLTEQGLKPVFAYAGYQIFEIR